MNEMFAKTYDSVENSDLSDGVVVEKKIGHH